MGAARIPKGRTGEDKRGFSADMSSVAIYHGRTMIGTGGKVTMEDGVKHVSKPKTTGAGKGGGGGGGY